MTVSAVSLLSLTPSLPLMLASGYSLARVLLPVPSPRYSGGRGGEETMNDEQNCSSSFIVPRSSFPSPHPCPLP